jgi:putative transposase
VKFAFVDAEKAFLPITRLCKSLGVSRSGFYASCGRAPSKHAQEDARLKVLVRESHARSGRRYGTPRVWKDLFEQKEYVSAKRVARLLREEGLRGRVPKRFRKAVVASGDPVVAPNLLDRDFTASAPNQRWVSDTTELAAGGTRFFLAAVLDLFSRYVVGWSVSTINNGQLVTKALEMGLKRRCPGAGLLHHSDQGSPYTSEDYQRQLSLRGITVSMSRRGNCYDNAVMESFFSTLKAELGETFEGVGIAKEQLFDFIEVFYNQQRRHSTLGQVSPAEFEKAARGMRDVA